MQGVFQRLATFLLLAQASVCAGPVLDFSGGFATASSTLNFNNASQISGNRARLTDNAGLQAGSVWSKNQVDIRKFSCLFAFQITPVDGSFEAGFTFALQRAGNTVSGYPYEALGYAPMTPSVAIKFDTWPGVSTTGLYINGAFPGDDGPASIDMAAAGINLHSGHIFTVLLVYDGVTLQETVTDTFTNATFTQSYAIDIPVTLDGSDAYAGFTASTGGTGSVHEILSWTYAVIPSAYDVNFTAFPERLQLYPRDRTTNLAIVPVAGTELVGGYTQALLRVYRNGVQIGSDLIQPLKYVGGKANFCFNPAVTAELAHYDVELFLRDSSNQLISVRRARDIVAGDVFVIQGQSNALAKTISGSASAYVSPYIRTVGFESSWPSAGPSVASWMTAIGDGMLDSDDIGDIGQWGLVMANELMATNKIPIAVINAGQGGEPIDFFQRNDSAHEDTSTNYGRLLNRLQKAHIATGVRAILFYQGESDNNDGAHYETGFTALHAAWLEDYPSLEHIYVFQLRESASDARFNVDLRDRQRRFAHKFANLSVLSTNGLDGHDGLHFYFKDGYETMGVNAARMIQRDLYHGSALSNTNSPNPLAAVLMGQNKNIIYIPLRDRMDTVTFDPSAIADFAVMGAPARVIDGRIANGAAIRLTLSRDATGATAIVYTGHSGPATGGWVRNANGIGLLSFIEPLVPREAQRKRPLGFVRQSAN